MKVKITSINEAKIKTVHDDLEGPQDEKHVVLSMPMSMFVKMDEVNALVGCFEGQSVVDFYWIRDELGYFSPRYKNIGPQQLKGVHNNGVLVIGEENFSDCRLTKARFTPWQGDQAFLSCTISIINPKKKDLERILKFKGCSLPISFEGDASLFEDIEPQEGEESQPSLLEQPQPEIVDEELSADEEAELNDEVVDEPEEEVVELE